MISAIQRLVILVVISLRLISPRRRADGRDLNPKCLQTLRVLIDVGDVQAIERAERAIDELVASQDGPDRQTEALNVLDQEVTSLAQDKPDRSFEFVETILGYIYERVQELQKGEWTALRDSTRGYGKFNIAGGPGSSSK